MKIDFLEKIAKWTPAQMWYFISRMLLFVFILIAIAVLLSCCRKNNMSLETWVVWRGHDRVAVHGAAYFCTGHIEGTKTLSRNSDDTLHYAGHIDSLVEHPAINDSIDRDYIEWKYKIKL
jgi:hypothetical protein